jgi:phosphotransacetylase
MAGNNALVATFSREGSDQKHIRFRNLLERCKGLPAIRMAVVHPCDDESLRGALDATAAGLIEPVLVGPEEKIRRAACDAGCDLDGIEIVPVPHSHAAADVAVTMAHDGRVDALMKGSLHTDELMHAVLRQESGLRIGRRISHAFAIDAPTYTHPLIVTDAAINILPDLEAKRDICQNAIHLAKVLGIIERRVAVLAAVETVTSSMPVTVDAAALSKMAERGQIVDAMVDGPLAMDSALSEASCRRKGIISSVAGRANILVVPNVEAGNMLVKQLVLLAEAIAAGIVLGARVPIALTSRADGPHARIASAAIAVLLVHQRLNRDGSAQLVPAPSPAPRAASPIESGRVSV